MSLQPLLRIFHVSDTHFVTARSARSSLHSTALRLALTTKLPSVAKLGHKLGQGCAGHSSVALRCLRDSLLQAAEADDAWRDRTALVVTGDLTTWGDAASMSSITRFFSKLEADAHVHLRSVYGNHDVWPGEPNEWKGLPMFTGSNTLAGNRTVFRQSHFPTSAPYVHEGPVTLATLNSVRHESVENQLALGRITQDWYWNADMATPKEQSELLSEALGTVRLAVILTHHPVLDSDGTPIDSGLAEHGLRNGTAVTEKLGSWPGPGRAVRLYLSGHTHEVAPAPEALEELSVDTSGKVVQLQLVSGSATQRAFHTSTPIQTWNLLHLFHDPTNDRLVIERIVFIRPDGRREFMPLGDEDGNCAEVIEVPLQ